jgi:CubicO group peptidase (beta-lactamase class C family)
VRHLLRASVALLGLCCTAGAEAAPAAGTAPERIDAIAQEVIERYDLPGIALGVVEDGEVVFARGYGETVAGSGEAVDVDTVFKIASNTKAMTAALLARLVDAGRLRWDDPVIKHLPRFRMHDPWVTREMQVRDLLIHNAGLREGAGDLMLWPEPNHFTRDDIIAGLAHLRPQQSFRSGYAYDNLLYVVAGEVAAAAGGASYEELVRREVFEPLGLARCRVGAFDREALGNVAQPHTRGEGGNVAMRLDPPQVPAITSAAAGGIRCSLGDMLAWARNWLAPTPAQLEWLPAERRAELWTAHTPMPVSALRREWDGTRFYAYGYGWRLADIDGEWSVSHTGTLGGMYSQLHLLPELGDGFVFMINGDAGQARTVLNQVLVEHLTPDGESRSVGEVVAALEARRGGVDAASEMPDTSDRRPATAKATEQWLGTWRDPWFGEVTICPAGDRVEFKSAKSPRLRGDLMRVGDRHLVAWHADHAEAWADFTVTDGVRRLAMAKVDPQADFSYDYEDLAFVRTGDCPAKPAGTGG